MKSWKTICAILLLVTTLCGCSLEPQTQPTFETVYDQIRSEQMIAPGW